MDRTARGHCHGCNRYTRQQITSVAAVCMHCGFENVQLHECDDYNGYSLECRDCRKLIVPVKTTTT